MNKVTAAYESMYEDPKYRPRCHKCGYRMSRVTFAIATCNSCGETHNITGFIPLKAKQIPDDDEQDVSILPKRRFLTESNKRLIRKIYMQHWEDMDNQELAEAFGVSLKTINNIVEYKL